MTRPSWLKLNANYQLVGTPPHPGIFPIKVYIDGKKFLSFTIKIKGGKKPRISSLPPKKVYQGDSFYYQIEAEDVYREPLKIQVSTLPDGLIFDERRNRIVGRILGDDQLTFTIQVTNQSRLSDQQQFSIPISNKTIGKKALRITDLIPLQAQFGEPYKAILLASENNKAHLKYFIKKIAPKEARSLGFTINDRGIVTTRHKIKGGNFSLEFQITDLISHTDVSKKFAFHIQGPQEEEDAKNKLEYTLGEESKDEEIRKRVTARMEQIQGLPPEQQKRELTKLLLLAGMDHEGLSAKDQELNINLARAATLYIQKQGPASPPTLKPVQSEKEISKDKAKEARKASRKARRKALESVRKQEGRLQDTSYIANQQKREEEYLKILASGKIWQTPETQIEGPSLWKNLKLNAKRRLSHEKLLMTSTIGNRLASVKSAAYQKMRSGKSPLHRPFIRLSTIHLKIKRGKKEQGSLVGYAAFALIRRSINAFIDISIKVGKAGLTIARDVPLVNGVINRVANTKTVKWMRAAEGDKTFVGDGMKRVGDKVQRSYQGVKGWVTPKVKVIGKVFKGIGYGARMTGLAIKSLGKGSIFGLALSTMTGGNLAAFAAGTVIGTASNITTELLTANKFSRFRPLRRFQIVHARTGNYSSVGGLANKASSPRRLADLFKVGENNPRNSLLRRIGTEGSVLGLGVRSLNFGMSLGSLMSLIAPLLGMDPTQAFLLGAGSGTLAKFTQLFIKSKLGNFMKRGNLPPLFKTMMRFPTQNFLLHMRGSHWFISQLNKLYAHRGNLKQYFAQEWNINSKDPSSLIMMLGNLAGGFGYISATSSLASSLVGVTLATESTSVTAQGVAKTILIPAKISIPGVMVGSIAGSIAGFALATALGIGTGPAAMIGAAIGATIGTVVGAFIAALVTGLTDGLMFWATTAIVGFFTAIGQTIGQAIGATFDKTLSNTIGGLFKAINSLTAILGLAKLATGNRSINTILSIALTLPMLANILSKGMTQLEETRCYPDDEQCQGAQGALPHQQYPLSHYGVTLISQQETDWTSGQITSILEILRTLDTEDAEILQKQKTYIAIGKDETYIEERFVLIGVSPKQLSNVKKELSTVIATIKSEDFTEHVSLSTLD